MEKEYAEILYKLNDFQSEIDNQFTKFIHNLTPQLIEYIREKVTETKSFFLKDKSFKLELVVDTNIIFSEVRSLCVNNSSFFLKISENPLIKIYAPKKLKEELYEKIKIKFPKEKKTRDLEIEDCLKKADLILSKIEIRNDISKKSLKKATKIMKERDKDDISFVALNFSLNTHGVLTRDKDIKDQKEVKTWELKDAGKVITEVNKGSISFLILNTSTPIILEIIYSLLNVVWASIVSIVNGFIKLFISILTGSIEMISKIPNEFLLLIAGVLLFAKEVRNEIGNFLKTVWEFILGILNKIKELFLEIWQVITEFFNELRPLLKSSWDLITYLSIQSSQAIEHFELLELKEPE